MRNTFGRTVWGWLVAMAVAAPAATARAQGEAETAPAATAPPAPPAATQTPREGVSFGSYGRIGAGTEGDGSAPRPVTVVTHGARVVEDNYAELDVYYRMRPAADVQVRTHVTAAIADDLFHYTGELDATIAIRNLYAEVVFRDTLSGWVGSRMYRGDDIYLLDFWPLDDINTLGAGVRYDAGSLAVASHVGVNRLADEFQLQRVDVPDPDFGEQTVTLLDRQRYIATAKATYRVLDEPDAISAKAILWTELEGMPSGTRRVDDNTLEDVPADYGFAVGGQLGAWGFGEAGSHANLFVRYARGLRAFDELTVPFGFDTEDRVFPDAGELVIGLSANYNVDRFGALAGGYVRRFVDADPNELDRDDGWEYIADVRPYVALTSILQAAVDVSYQQRFPRGVSPTALTAMDPAVFQVAPMLLISPLGAGSYSRPQLRLIYRAAHANAGARDLYALEDPRRDETWTHFVGVMAEWWFNSSYR